MFGSGGAMAMGGMPGGPSPGSQGNANFGGGRGNMDFPDGPLPPNGAPGGLLSMGGLLDEVPESMMARRPQRGPLVGGPPVGGMMGMPPPRGGMMDGGSGMGMYPMVPIPPDANYSGRQAVMNMMGMLAATMPAGWFNIPGMPGASKHIQPDGADLSIPPNRTLYVNNLDDRIKTDQLQRELRAVFANFGKILDIVAMKSFWRRGQAWVVFAEQEAASNAVQGLQGFEYHGKKMRINYARTTSDIFAKQEGTFVERSKGLRKPRAIIEREQKLQQQLKQMLVLQQRGTLPPQAKLDSEEDGYPASDGGNQDVTGMMPPPFAVGPGGTMPPSDGLPGGGLLGSGQGGPGGNAAGGDGILPRPGANEAAVAGGMPRGVPPPPSSIPGPLAPVLPGPGGEGGMSRVPPSAMDKQSIVAAAAAQAAEAAQSAKKRRFDAPPAAPMAAPADVYSSATPIPPPLAASGPATHDPTPFFFPHMGIPPAFMGFAAPNLPNKTLFVENLAEDTNEGTLHALFTKFAGMLEVRHIAARKVAFVEYDNEVQAGGAMNGLQNFEISLGRKLRISYAKR